MSSVSSNSEVKLHDPTTNRSPSLLSTLKYSGSPVSPVICQRLLILVFPASNPFIAGHKGHLLMWSEPSQCPVCRYVDWSDVLEQKKKQRIDVQSSFFLHWWSPVLDRAANILVCWSLGFGRGDRGWMCRFISKGSFQHSLHCLPCLCPEVPTHKNIEQRVYAAVGICKCCRDVIPEDQ